MTPKLKAAVANRCPTCTSPAPHLHPAMQSGGEVQPCRDVWHRRITAENTVDRLAEADALNLGEP